MAQQHAIIVLVDAAGAIQSRTLDGNVYLFDNMKFLGSTGQGTGDLVTVVPGAYWSDGSQATEQVLNWLPYNLGSIPPTVPRSYHADRARETDRQALDALSSVAEGYSDPSVDTAADLNRLQRRVGTQAGRKRGGRNLATSKVLDITDNVVNDESQAYNY